MRKIVLLLILFVTCLQVKAQDVITLKGGKEINAKVLEVTAGGIKYKRKGMIDTMNKAEAVMIRYKGGRKEYLDKSPEGLMTNINVADTTSHANDALLTVRGTEDARKYYVKYKSPQSWTIATACILSPVAGLIPAVACSVTPAREKNLNCPYPALLQNPVYGDAYRHKAHKIKAEKTFIGLGIGTAIFIVLTAFIKYGIK